MLLHAHGQSLHAAQNEPALERRQNRACGFLDESQLVSLFLRRANHNAAEAVAVSVKNFVVEWTTMSAPRAIGCWKYGDMKVLSTTSSAFLRRHTWLMAAMSLSDMSGFVGVSIYTMRVFFRMARSTFFASEVST